MRSFFLAAGVRDLRTWICRRSSCRASDRSDTQRWLQGEDKPTDTCPEGSPDAVIRKLTQILVTDLAVIVTAHHPLATHGRHGGFFEWQAHLFPLTHVASGCGYPFQAWDLFTRCSAGTFGGATKTSSVV